MSTHTTTPTPSGNVADPAENVVAQAEAQPQPAAAAAPSRKRAAPDDRSSGWSEQQRRILKAKAVLANLIRDIARTAVAEPRFAQSLRSTAPKLAQLIRDVALVNKRNKAASSSAAKAPDDQPDDQPDSYVECFERYGNVALLASSSSNKKRKTTAPRYFLEARHGEHGEKKIDTFMLVTESNAGQSKSCATKMLWSGGRSVVVELLVWADEPLRMVYQCGIHELQQIQAMLNPRVGTLVEDCAVKFKRAVERHFGDWLRVEVCTV